MKSVLEGLDLLLDGLVLRQISKYAVESPSPVSQAQETLLSRDIPLHGVGVECGAARAGMCCLVHFGRSRFVNPCPLAPRGEILTADVTVDCQSPTFYFHSEPVASPARADKLNLPSSRGSVVR